MRIDLGYDEKVKTLFEKGLRKFQRAVAKFSQSLTFFTQQ